MATTNTLLPAALLLVKSAVINVYPGKKSTQGNARIIRRTLEEKKMTIINNKQTCEDIYHQEFILKSRSHDKLALLARMNLMIITHDVTAGN